MAKGEDWSRAEVEATVADYFAMLDLELRGEPYSKADHNRQLQRLLDDRTKASIEFKHQNISAVLIDLGYPYIEGYKPAVNYQQLLYEVVADRLASEKALTLTVAAQVEAPATVPTVDDILSRLENPPKIEERPVGRVAERPRVAIPPRNYLEIEARNHRLARAGEEFALNFERAYLINQGKSKLADRVDHVAVTKGDGLGYDIHSFDPDGRDRLVEVKTTAYGKATPFFVSRNEVQTSRDLAASYVVLRLFKFRDDPRLFTLKGAIDASCRIDPVQFSARVRST